jgi:hypothetical protein
MKSSKLVLLSTFELECCFQNEVSLVANKKGKHTHTKIPDHNFTLYMTYIHVSGLSPTVTT